MEAEVRNCKTCGHRDGTGCLLSGYSCTVERQTPTICGRDFEKWVSKKYPGRDPMKKKSILSRVKKSLGFYEKPKNPLLEGLDDLDDELDSD